MDEASSDHGETPVQIYIFPYHPAPSLAFSGPSSPCPCEFVLCGCTSFHEFSACERLHYTQGITLNCTKQIAGVSPGVLFLKWKGEMQFMKDAGKYVSPQANIREGS